VDEKHLAKARKAMIKAGARDPIVISAAAGDGVDALLDTIIERLGPESETAEPEEADGRAWSPL
jgi:predicted GTPase